MSAATYDELSDVVSRPKFDAYLTREDRQTFFLPLGRVSEFVEITESVQACRDPKDDKFLELAVAGRANSIVMGDVDVLRLSPFRGIPIIKPLSFLELGPKKHEQL